MRGPRPVATIRIVTGNVRALTGMADLQSVRWRTESTGQLFYACNHRHHLAPCCALAKLTCLRN